jgi:hypothetical protein
MRPVAQLEEAACLNHAQCRSEPVQGDTPTPAPPRRNLNHEGISPLRMASCPGPAGVVPVGMRTKRDVLTVLNEALETFHARLCAIEVGMTEWTPKVVLTDDQLEKILATREPLTIPEHAADLVREVARYGSYTYRQNIGSSAFVGMDWSLNPDGSIDLELLDQCGRRFWRGKFLAA